MNIIEEVKAHNYFAVYTAVALKERMDKNKIAAFVKSQRQVPIYFGQSQKDDISCYHFKVGGQSALTKILQSCQQIFHWRTWTFSNANDMYRMESAMIVSHQHHHIYGNYTCNMTHLNSDTL